MTDSIVPLPRPVMLVLQSLCHLICDNLTLHALDVVLREDYHHQLSYECDFGSYRCMLGTFFI